MTKNSKMKQLRHWTRKTDEFHWFFNAMLLLKLTLWFATKSVMTAGERCVVKPAVVSGSSSAGDPAMEAASEIPRLKASFGDPQPSLERLVLVSKELDIDLLGEKDELASSCYEQRYDKMAYLGTLQCQLLFYLTCIHSKPDKKLQQEGIGMQFTLATGSKIAIGASHHSRFFHCPVTSHHHWTGPPSRQNVTGGWLYRTESALHGYHTTQCKPS